MCLVTVRTLDLDIFGVLVFSCTFSIKAFVFKLMAW